MRKLIERFVETTNTSDVDAALALFSADAVIEDVSVGETFANTAGIRRYLEQFFVGYRTVSRLESVELIDARHAKAQLDFTGDFGHETGALNVTINADGLIESINAYLD